VGTKPFVVFVVDDDVAVRDGLSLLMRSAGFQVRSCGTEEELLALSSDATAGCVLMDMSVPAGPGAPLGTRLRERGVHLPLIALTAGAEDAADRCARAAGAQFLLRKPVDDRALLDAISWVSGGMRSSNGGR
jgi:FixJ family two-component response regulator